MDDHVERRQLTKVRRAFISPADASITYMVYRLCWRLEDKAPRLVALERNSTCVNEGEVPREEWKKNEVAESLAGLMKHVEPAHLSPSLH